jgi:hypothetical protein
MTMTESYRNPDRPAPNPSPTPNPNPSPVSGRGGNPDGPTPNPTPTPGAPALPIIDGSNPVVPPPVEPTIDSSALAYLRGLLESWGLGSLTDWAYGLLVDDRSADEIVQQLRDRQEYKDRFKAIIQRRDAGLPAISEAEVLDYERTARGMFRAAGLPDGFYDSPDDYTALLVADVSASELQTRIQDGFVRVANADPSIRAYFAEAFGADGDGALAAAFLDPGRALPLLQRQVAAAELGGLGANFGFEIGTGRALETVTRTGPMSQDQIAGGFQRLAQVRPVFQETLSERDDYTAAGEGLDFAFDTGSAERIRGRIQQRLAVLGGGSGRVAQGQRGLLGNR